MRYKAALVGCGRISFKHIEAFVDNKDDLDLIAVCDVVKERAQKKAREYLSKVPESNVEIFDDYKKMLKKIKPDICVIATESGNHCKHVMDSLKSNCHVIVEKPMALSSKDAEKMIMAAKKSNKKLAVCFQNRFNPPIQKAYEALVGKRFGRMLHGAIQIRWNRNEQYYKEAPWRGTWEMDGGVLMNQCTHGIDLLQWLMGSEVVKVTGVTRRFQRPIDAEDFGSAILEFKNGSVGVIEGSANIYPRNLDETLSLFGEKGTVVIGGLAVNKIQTWRFADEEIVLDPLVKDPPTVYGFGHTHLYADFVKSIRENIDPFISGEAGKAALEIILAIYKSMKTGKSVKMPVKFDTGKMKGFF